MKIKNWSTFATVLALFLAAVLFQPARHASVKAQSQIPAPSKAKEEGGLRIPGSDEASKFEEATFETEESLDKESVEERVKADTFGDRIPIPLPGGLDHVANGSGSRNAGFGAIRLRGVPAGAVAVRAFLYWGVIIPPPAPATATVVFNGVAVTGSLVGVATQPCWNSAGVFAGYRANVLGLLTAQINADYPVTGMPSSVTNGSNPWSPFVNTLPLAEGTSLVVVYSHSSLPPAATVLISNGPKRFDNGTFDFTHLLPSAVPNHTVLKHTRLGADGQVGIPIPGSGLRSFANITNEQTFIGRPSAGTFTQIKGIGAPLNQDSDWNGYDGDPLNKLWDTHTDDITGAIAVGDTSYIVRYVAGIDCSCWLVHILGIR
jgi:hypothetical protein